MLDVDAVIFSLKLIHAVTGLPVWLSIVLNGGVCAFYTAIVSIDALLSLFRCPLIVFNAATADRYKVVRTIIIT